MLFCVLYIIVLCIVVPLPPGTHPLAVNNNNNKHHVISSRSPKVCNSASEFPKLDFGPFSLKPKLKMGTSTSQFLGRVPGRLPFIFCLCGTAGDSAPPTRWFFW